MLNEHKRHQIELNSMRQSSRKQHQKLKEFLPALLASWPQHCCRRRDPGSKCHLVRLSCPLPPISTTAWMWCTVARCRLGQPNVEGEDVRKLERRHAPNFADLDPCARSAQGRKDLAKAYRLKAASLHPEKAGGHELLCAVDTAHDRHLFAPTAYLSKTQHTQTPPTHPYIFWILFY